MNLFHRNFLVFVLIVAFPCMSFAQEALEKLVKHREMFGKKFREHGMSFRLEQHVGSKKETWEIQLEGDYSVARFLGRSISDPFDDRIFVKGPLFSFALQVVKDNSGGQAFSLIDMVASGTVISTDSDLAAGIVGVVQNAKNYPWRFEGLDLEDIREKYEVFTASEPNAEEVWIEFSGPKDVAGMIHDRMFVDREVKLVFRADHKWRLAKAEWSRENYNSNGKKTESFTASRDYFFEDNEFGHGKFENGEFLDGTDTISNTATPVAFGRRAIWKPIDIDPAIFTPEHYGIESRMAVARANHWFLWIGILVSISTIAFGLWMRRRALTAAK